MKHISCILFFILALGTLSYTTAQNKRYSITKVVIDAGHGGHDPGCLGAKSKEKDIALAIALKFGKHIEDNFKDVQVIYTRKTDVFVELHERASIANTNRADLFICIHCNSGNKDAFGAETYVMGLHRSGDNLTVSKRENAAILMEDNYKAKYDGFDPNSPEANIIFSLYQNAFLDQSLHFASNIQKQFKERRARFDRGVKQAGFLVLYKTAMPSILIETGFLTNKEDENFLSSEEGQDHIAYDIFKAFSEYKTEVETGKVVKTDTKPKEKEVKEESKTDKDKKDSLAAIAFLKERDLKDKKEKEEKEEKVKKDSLAAEVKRKDQEKLNEANERKKKQQDSLAADIVKYKASQVESAKAKKKSEDSIAVLVAAKRSPLADTLLKKMEKLKEVKKDTPVAALLFSVQIATSLASKPISHESENFKKITEPIHTERTPEGMMKYMVGSYSNFNDALRLQKNLRERGFSDAFIVAYNNGIRISIQEALSLIKKK